MLRPPAAGVLGGLLLTAIALVSPQAGSTAPKASAKGSLVFIQNSDPPGRASKIVSFVPRDGAARELSSRRGPVYDVDVSPDGRHVAYVTSGGSGDQLRLVGMNGKDDQHLFGEALIIDRIDWTPDGERIVYSAGPYDRRGDRQLRRSEIYSIAADGGEPTRLTRDDRGDFDPSVTPDGERIVFSRNAELPEPNEPPQLDLHSMAIDGSDIQQITATPRDETEVEVSPDGDRMAFVRRLGAGPANGRRNFVVQVADIDGSGVVTVKRGRGDDRHPTWSPDGRRIAFDSDRADKRATDGYFRTQVYTARADGTGVERLVGVPFGIGVPSYVP